MRPMDVRRVMLLLALLAWNPLRAESLAPQPFTATYSASYRGIEAGNLMFSLVSSATTARR